MNAIKPLYSQCPYCERPVDNEGGINHIGGCFGLENADLNQLQYRDLTDEIERLTRERDDFSREVAGDRRQMADMVRRRDDLINENLRLRELLAERVPHLCDSPKPGVAYPDYPCGECWTCRVRKAIGVPLVPTQARPEPRKRPKVPSGVA